MNQDKDNLNSNSFNIQDNNGVPNNQPLNNQSFNNTFNQNVSQNLNVSSSTFSQQMPPMPSYEQPVTPQPTPQLINNTFEGGNGSNQNFNSKPPKKINPVLVIVIIAAVIIAIVGIVAIPKLFNKDNKAHDMANENSKVIIVNNKDNKNALFNEKGKQLTEFYDKINKFYNDIAIVKNNNEYAVLNSKGKFIINFKEYGYITNAGFIIKAQDDEFNYILIDNKGKVIKKIVDGEILNYWGYDELIIIKYENDYEILDSYTGSLIKKIKKVGADDLEVYSGEYNLTYVYYNNKTYIINYKTGKIINELTGEKQIRSVNSLNDAQYVIHEKNGNTFEYYNNDNQVFVNKDCDNLFFEYNSNNLICAIDYDKRYLMDNNGQKTIEILKSDIAYLDSKNYAINENYSTAFYVDGKKIKEVKDTYDAYTIGRSNKIYKLETKIGSDYKYQFYNFKGELITNQYFTNALEFDKKNLAIVSKNKKDFYLVDTSGNKVSKDYDSIRLENSLYVAKKNSIYFILDTNGKEILQKEVTSYDIKIYDNFFTILENKELKYYTLNGKNFYTVNY